MVLGVDFYYLVIFGYLGCKKLDFLGVNTENSVLGRDVLLYLHEDFQLLLLMHSSIFSYPCRPYGN